ncbi:MAG: hypothetical protein ACYC9Z_09530 [Casimicrobiaceae bacterium]
MSAKKAPEYPHPHPRRFQFGTVTATLKSEDQAHISRITFLGGRQRGCHSIDCITQRLISGWFKEPREDLASRARAGLNRFSLPKPRHSCLDGHKLGPAMPPAHPPLEQHQQGLRTCGKIEQEPVGILYPIHRVKR